MSKVTSFKRRNSNKIQVKGVPRMTVFVYFVAWREVGVQGDEHFRSMILAVPGPLRENIQLHRVEQMLREKANELAKEMPGIKVVGTDQMRVQITALSHLETYEQVVSEEEAAILEQKVRDLEEQKRNTPPGSGTVQ